MTVRTKRRLAIGTVAVLVIAAGASAFLATRSGASGSDPSKGGRRSKEVYGTFGAFAIPHGLHRDELAARVGEPVQKRNGCWTYRVQGGKFVGAGIPSSLGTVDAVRFCLLLRWRGDDRGSLAQGERT